MMYFWAYLTEHFLPPDLAWTSREILPNSDPYRFEAVFMGGQEGYSGGGGVGSLLFHLDEIWWNMKTRWNEVAWKKMMKYDEM